MTANTEPAPTEKAAPMSQDALAALAADLDALYQRARASVGSADLEHIRRVHSYSKAIRRRSDALLRDPADLEAWKRGILLGALHILLEFSELGHNIMHGSYDHLPDRGIFDSQTYEWDFVVDPQQWRTMHHGNHHPYTNIVGLDHDIGYSFLRLLPGQSWYGHSSLQTALLPVLLSIHVYYFTIYTATSAARTQGQPVLSRKTFAPSARLILRHMRDRYLRAPLQRGNRLLPTLAGNYLTTVLGYNLTIFLLIIEHHADNVELFHDPGPHESKGAWYRRQILATTNFTMESPFDTMFRELLREEVPYIDAPDFEIFYGGLETHLEHHLFPDLPCSAQRRIRPELQTICARHGLPYNVKPIDDMLPDLLQTARQLIWPVGEFERGSHTTLTARELFDRMRKGLRYKPNRDAYLDAPRFFQQPARIESLERFGDQAVHLRLRPPAGWESLSWPAGAYVSVALETPDAGGVLPAEVIRQYSLLNDSIGSSTLDLTIRHVPGGRVSGQAMRELFVGDTITLIGPPTHTPEFAIDEIPDSVVLVAGGVGVTPILAMARRIVREAPQTRLRILLFNRTAETALHEADLQALTGEGDRQLRCYYSEPGPSQGRPRLLNKTLLRRAIGPLAPTHVYCCAPAGMIELARTLSREIGLGRDRFHAEAFTADALDRSSGSDETFQITFARSRTSISVDGRTTLLEAARAAGVPAASGCEQGLCKACRVRRIEGQTGVDDPLGGDQITICNALPTSNVVLDL